MLLLTLLSLPSLLGASRVPCVEYVWTGVGHGSSWLPVRDPGSFCFLTSAGAWNRGSCGLRYDTAVSAWALEFASSLSTFHCGAREAMLAESNQSVCAFTHGQNWYLDGERCAIVMRGDFWVLASTSGQAEFACGARCALFDGPTIQSRLNRGLCKGSAQQAHQSHRRRQQACCHHRKANSSVGAKAQWTHGPHAEAQHLRRDLCQQAAATTVRLSSGLSW